MDKPGISLLALSISVVSLLLMSTGSIADVSKNKICEKAPPSCTLVLRDGLYMGLQGGYDMYRFASELPANGSISDIGTPVSFSADPTLFISGFLLGGFAGFGKQFYWFYHTYLGLEVYGNWSDAQTDASIYTSGAGPVNEYEADFQMSGTYGIDVLPGIMLSPATLFYLRLGYSWVSLNIDESIRMVNAPSTTQAVPVDLQTNTDVIGGFRFGVGIESAFAENWSVRAEYNHTQLNEINGKGDVDQLFSTGSEFSPTDNQFLLGIIYHFYI